MSDAPKFESPSEALRWPTVVSRVLFTIGILLSISFLLTSEMVLVIVIVIALSIAAHLAVWRPPRELPRPLKIAAWVWLIVLAGALGYATLCFGLVLWWAIHPALATAAVLALGLALATAIRPWKGVRVSLSLGAGLCIVGCLLGWSTEHQQIRCDDFAALTRQQDVTIAAPSVDLVAACADGGVVSLGRFPRKVGESPSGERLFVTTDRVAAPLPSDSFDGAACNISLTSGAVSCVLSGSSHGFAPAVDRGRIYVSNHDQIGEIVALDEETLAIEARAEVRQAANAWYDAEAGEVGVFTDDRDAFVHDAADLTRLADHSAEAQPDRLYYDSASDEGLLCFASGPIRSLDGEGFMALAFATSPFRERALGSSLLSRLSFSWGCGWDPITRRVYAGVTTLGLLVELDYDTGEIVGYTWVGPGTRPIQVDRERGLIYVGYFIDGRIVALRMDGSVAHRWFAGRFVRDIQMARDGQRLWVTSNMGVVEIRLP